VHPSTFSIVARDATTGECGVAVASKFLAVGAVVPWARAGAGAIATQAWANLSYGPDGLALLESGLGAADVVARLTAADDRRETRQLGVVDASGQSAAWTGKECMPWAGHLTSDGFTCQGNILTGEAVVHAMAATFERTAGPLPERILSALAAGQAAGGDSRGQQSGALYVVKEKGSYGGYLDRYVDVRVDDHPAPVDELRRLLDLHRLYFGETAAVSLTLLAGNVTKVLQEILAKAGVYAGPIDSVYGAETKEAFRRWCGIENFEERWREDDFVDRELLSFMRKKYGF
jgi:uncharacterized Ntn-hydrolase superfamily protein